MEALIPHHRAGELLVHCFTKQGAAKSYIDRNAGCEAIVASVALVDPMKLPTGSPLILKVIQSPGELDVIIGFQQINSDKPRVNDWLRDHPEHRKEDIKWVDAVVDVLMSHRDEARTLYQVPFSQDGKPTGRPIAGMHLPAWTHCHSHSMACSAAYDPTGAVEIVRGGSFIVYVHTVNEEQAITEATNRLREFNAKHDSTRRHSLRYIQYPNPRVII